MAELGETNDPKQLVPGKPEAIEENARVLQGRANSAAQAGQGLLAVDTGAWKGKAANEFHDKFTYEPRKWFYGEDALESGAEALTGYAETLRWAQVQATEAIARWNQSQAATQQAKDGHDKATKQNQEQNQPPPPPFSDPGEQHRQAAREILQNARQQLRGAGDEAASVLKGYAEKARNRRAGLTMRATSSLMPVGTC